MWFVPEDALEATRAAAFVRALLAARPYEEVAYELYAIVDA